MPMSRELCRRRVAARARRADGGRSAPRSAEVVGIGNVGVPQWARGVVGATAVVLAMITGIAAAGAATPVTQTSRVSATVTAAVAVAQSSRSQVTELHDLAVSAGHTKGIPASLVPASARGVAASLASELTTVRALHQSSTTATGHLVTSLSGYLTLANRLSSWNAKTAKPLPATFFMSLRKSDGIWRSALTSLGASDRVNLFVGMPTLLFPKSS